MKFGRLNYLAERFAQLAAALAAVFLVAAAGEAQRDPFEGVELTIVHVAGNVYMLQRPGGGAT